LTLFSDKYLRYQVAQRLTTLLRNGMPSSLEINLGEIASSLRSSQ